METERRRSLLEQLPSLVRRAQTADEAVGIIAREVKTVIPSMWRASASKLLPGSAQLECVAVWSEVDTLVKPGVRVATLATAFPEMLKLRRPIVSAEHDGPKTPLKRALMSERTLSWLAIPIADGDAITGLLGFSGDEWNGFKTEDLSFYAALGRGVEDRLVELM